MRNNEDINDVSNQETTTVVMTPVKPLSFFRAVISQANFQSRLHKESWYGHHFPFRRLIFFLTLYNVMAAIHEVSSWPFSNDDMRTISELNVDCLLEISEIVKTIPNCIVNEDGKSAKIDFEEYEGPLDVPFPGNCKKVADMIGKLKPQTEQDESTLDQSVLDASLNLIRFETPEKRDSEKAFVTVDHTCHFYYSVRDNSKALLLSDKELEENGGKSVEATMKKDFCDKLIPAITKFQAALLQSPAIFRPLLLLVSLCAFMINQLTMLVFHGFGLLLTTFVLRLVLRWPNNFVGYEKITFWAVWTNLLVLTFVNVSYCDYNNPSFWLKIIFCASMIAVAWFVFEDRDAARSWLDLAVLWHGLPFLVPYMDMARQWIHRFDILDLVGWVSMLINIVVPGSQGEKFVFLWVFWQSYPCRNHVKGRVLAWLGLQSNEMDAIDETTVEEKKSS